jgi:hypothetical protein
MSHEEKPTVGELIACLAAIWSIFALSYMAMLMG